MRDPVASSLFPDQTIAGLVVSFSAEVLELRSQQCEIVDRIDAIADQ